MTVPTKDIKILWAKAAGRCSMPDCREQLVAEAEADKKSRPVLIGENCHIVAEKPGGPRGQSPFTELERNQYSNLILLCRNHHAVIDKLPQQWPVERLHKIKAEHELWIEAQLKGNQLSQAEEWYTTLVEKATEDLRLEAWDRISDHAIRGMLSNRFVEGCGEFGTTVFRAVWPNEKLELKEVIVNLEERVNAYIKHFVSLAHLRDDGTWVEDKSWKREWRSDYHEYADRSREWEQKSINLLSNVVVALNEFADAVRQLLIPDYLIFQGKFTLYDALGVTNDLREIHYMPSSYIDIA